MQKGYGDRDSSHTRIAMYPKVSFQCAVLCCLHPMLAGQGHAECKEACRSCGTASSSTRITWGRSPSIDSPSRRVHRSIALVIGLATVIYGNMVVRRVFCPQGIYVLYVQQQIHLQWSNKNEHKLELGQAFFIWSPSGLFQGLPCQTILR